MTIILSFVSMIVLRMEGKEEACVEAMKACMEEGTCMEESGSLSRSMEGWETGPGWLRCCFIYTLVFTVS